MAVPLKRRQSPGRGEVLNRGMINAGAADGDMNVRGRMKCRVLRRQRDRRRRLAPWRGFIAVGGDPDDAIDFAAGHKSTAIKQPRIVIRNGAAEAGAHRKASHPPTDLKYADRVSFWPERQA